VVQQPLSRKIEARRQFMTRQAPGPAGALACHKFRKRSSSPGGQKNF